MAAARIAAVLLVALAPPAFTQQYPSSLVTVQVTDTTGAPVPGALVESSDLCASQIGGETDERGSLSLRLDPGPWDTPLTVEFPGFCPETKTIRVLDQPRQTVSVELEPGGCPSKCTPVCVVVDPVQTAQSPPRGIGVLVKDQTGAVVPGARIEVDPSLPTPGPVLNADSNGRALIDLPGGDHVFSISAPGFRRWTHLFEVSGTSGRLIEAVLHVAPICDPVVVAVFDEDIPLGIPDPIFLPLQPLMNLDPLPSRPAKKRR